MQGNINSKNLWITLNLFYLYFKLFLIIFKHVNTVQLQVIFRNLNTFLANMKVYILFLPFINLYNHKHITHLFTK